MPRYFLDEGFTQKAGDVKELILKPDGDGTEGEAVFSLNSSDQDQTFLSGSDGCFWNAFDRSGNL